MNTDTLLSAQARRLSLRATRVLAVLTWAAAMVLSLVTWVDSTAPLALALLLAAAHFVLARPLVQRAAGLSRFVFMLLYAVLIVITIEGVARLNAAFFGPTLRMF